MWDTIIEQVFSYAIVSSVIIICLTIATIAFILWGFRSASHYKIVVIICIAAGVIIFGLLCNEFAEIYLDIRNEDYITYRGEYIVRGGGMSDLTTYVVYDESGKEIRLLGSARGDEDGIYAGTVIYGRRSEIVVEYSGSPKQ